MGVVWQSFGERIGNTGVGSSERSAFWTVRTIRYFRMLNRQSGRHTLFRTCVLPLKIGPFSPTTVAGIAFPARVTVPISVRIARATARFAFFKLVFFSICAQRHNDTCASPGPAFSRRLLLGTRPRHRPPYALIRHLYPRSLKRETIEPHKCRR